MCSNAVESFLATSPDMYASIVSRRDMGRRSVSDPGFGMGTLLVCLALCGRMRCMSVCSMMFSMRSIHCGGRRPRRLSVKFWCLALLGVCCMMSVRCMLKFGDSFCWLYVKGHARASCGGGV